MFVLVWRGVVAGFFNLWGLTKIAQLTKVATGHLSDILITDIDAQDLFL